MNEIKDTVSKLGVRTEIFSNKCINIEGCDCILDYSYECIKIKSGRMKIEVKGKNLRIKSLTEFSVTIQGSVHGVEFTY